MTVTVKWFVSAIIPGVKQLGVMQFESSEAEHKKIAEKLCGQRAQFRSYRIEEFEDELPINEFVSADKLKELGY